MNKEKTVMVHLYGHDVSPRKSFVTTGYRPLFLINGEYHSGMMEFNGKRNPGEKFNCTVIFPSDAFQLKKFDTIKFCEIPGKFIGEAEVLD